MYISARFDLTAINSPIQANLKACMGLTDKGQMAKILTGNWLIAENLTDNLHLWWAFTDSWQKTGSPEIS